MSLNVRPVVMKDKGRPALRRGMGRCPTCGRLIELNVSSDGYRIIRCRPCGMFGQVLKPPAGFRPRPTELRRLKNRWRVQD